MKEEGGEKGLDAILMPGYQGVAPKHDTYGLPIYTVVVNLLNWPSGILRVGRAEKEKDAEFAKEGVKFEPPCKLLLTVKGMIRANVSCYR